MRVSRSFVAAILLLTITVPVSADPGITSRLSWVTNGDVQAAVQVGNTLYIGGTFTRVAPASGALGSFFGVSTITGEPLPLFPLVDGIVHAIEADGAGGYYIGGAFTNVGGVARTNLARVLADGSVDPAFAPTITGGLVRTLALGDAFLFVGGTFGGVNGTARTGFATLHPTTGATIVLPLPAFSEVILANKILVAGTNVIVLTSVETPSPGLPPRVRTFDQTTGASVWSTALEGAARDAIIAGTRLIVGGQSLQADRRMVVSLDVTTGVVDPAWVPSGSPPAGSSDAVNTLAASGSTLYVGGAFATFGGEPRANAAAVDIAAGTVTTWAPDPNAEITALATTLTSTVVLSGRYAQVDGETRDTFAEVDASGTVTAWMANAQAGTVRTIRVDAAGNLIVGGHVGVTDGAVRTNLAAFDSSTDTLLPWAPATSDVVTALAAIESRIYIGASRLVSGPTPSTRGVVSAVDGVSGAPLAWTPPASFTDVTLLGTHGAHVYVGGSFPTGSLIRLDGLSAAIDPGWRPQVAVPTRMVVSGNTIYVATVNGAAAVDVATGTRSSWSPSLISAVGATVTINGLAIDGRTVYISFRHQTFMGSVTHQVLGFDAVTALRTGPLGFSFGSGLGLPDAIAVADGQLIMARVLSSTFLVEPVAGVVAFDAIGQATSWNPGYVRVDVDLPKPNIVVTPTDVILLGYQGTLPVPVQGIAVLPRTASVGPTSLRATTVDNQVTLTWDAPSTPPASGYLVDVGSQPASASPLSLPTGSSATSISAVAGNGTYYARVRAAGAPAGPASLPTNEIALVVGCDAAPTAPPLNLAAQVSGSDVTISWTAPPFTSASRYVLEAGSSTGSTDIGTFTVAVPQTSIGGVVPAGTYFVRMHTANACGSSTASSEISFTVGSADAIPPAPTGLSASVSGFSVGIQWTPTAGALGYVMEVGSAPGLSNITTMPLSAFNFFVNGVPTGTYYLRVRAANAAGLSAPSSELIIVVPQ